MITLDSHFFDSLCAVKWFSECGKAGTASPGFCFAVSRDEALQLMSGPLWADVRTEAQGDITGYLAKHHYTLYGGVWNTLAKESRARLQREVLPLLERGVANAGLPDIAQNVLLDLNRASLESAYAAKCPRVPRFFDRLLSIYRAGRLPCGWKGDLKTWPQGDVIFY